MNELLKQKLDEEQAEIIESTEKHIVVSACPGSGKTYTLVKKIKKELESIDDGKGIIACSFTNESSDEIKNRLGSKYNLDDSYIGTIDSFIKYIISMFVNRTLDYLNIKHEQILISKKIFLPTDILKIKGKTYINPNDKNRRLTLNDIVRMYSTDVFYQDLAKAYSREEWLPKLLKSEYEVSFPAYFFATRILFMDVFQNWFNNHFTTIYIDEAQDLNSFQHIFFDVMKKKMNINMVMLGDSNQSIYQFRGAKPNLFNGLVNKGYKEYKLSYSCRCNPNITEIANRIYSRKKGKVEEKVVSRIESFDIAFLKSLQGGTFILTDTNNDALDLYEKYKKYDYDILYSKKLDLDENYLDYKENSLIVDELIKYFYNYDNKEDQYKYPFVKIEPILKNVNPKIKKDDFNLKKFKTIGAFLKYSCLVLDINLSDKTIKTIEQMLDRDEYKYYYYLSTHKNKIMTIHTSKGLENDNVIIYLTSTRDRPFSEEFKNKLFVAITRAKNSVYIVSSGNEWVTRFIDYLLV